LDLLCLGEEEVDEGSTTEGDQAKEDKGAVFHGVQHVDSHLTDDELLPS